MAAEILNTAAIALDTAAGAKVSALTARAVRRPGMAVGQVD
jgi:hypothetical protein